MTKADLVERVTASMARTAGPTISKKDCARVVDAFLDAIKDALHEQRNIEVRGLRHVQDSPAQDAHGAQPAHGSPVEVSARPVPVFKPSKELRALVAGHRRVELHDEDETVRVRARLSAATSIRRATASRAAGPFAFRWPRAAFPTHPLRSRRVRVQVLLFASYADALGASELAARPRAGRHRGRRAGRRARPSRCAPAAAGAARAVNERWAPADQPLAGGGRGGAAPSGGRRMTATAPSALVRSRVAPLDVARSSPRGARRCRGGRRLPRHRARRERRARRRGDRLRARTSRWRRASSRASPPKPSGAGRARASRVAHRVGYLRLGEAAWHRVVASRTAPRRFEACRWVLEAIKRARAGVEARALRGRRARLGGRARRRVDGRGTRADVRDGRGSIRPGGVRAVLVDGFGPPHPLPAPVAHRPVQLPLRLLHAGGRGCRGCPRGRCSPTTRSSRSCASWCRSGCSRCA
jgi:nucleoid DNA-binding protein